jgi:hypothetical protein
MEKKCFKCGEIKSLDNFYKHKKMPDGHLNKCKSCCKQYQKRRNAILSEDPEWMESERERQREKYQRLNYKGKQLEWNSKKPWKKTSTYKNLSRKFKTPKGIELHHWNYNDEFLEDVFFLSASEHKKVHTKIVLDFEMKMFRDMDGNLLDTKEKHKKIIESI